jgi:hypothetical protein
MFSFILFDAILFYLSILDFIEFILSFLIFFILYNHLDYILTKYIKY